MRPRGLALRILIGDIRRGEAAGGRNFKIVKARRVEAEDLPLDVERERRPGFAVETVGELEGHEFLDDPLWTCDAIVGAEDQPVRTEEVQKVRQHLREIFRPGMNEGGDQG